MSSKVVIGFDSSLDFIRYSRCRHFVPTASSRLTTIEGAVCNQSDIDRFDVPFFERTDDMLHVLVPNRASIRMNDEFVVCHLWQQPLTSGQFNRIGNSVYVASPELCFIQLAQHLDLVSLMLLGYEFCGMYSLCAAGRSGSTGALPATSVQKMKSLIDRMPNARGIKKSRLAIKHVCDNSNSPMESSLTLMLCLPVHYGGYAIPYPELNPESHLGKRGAKAHGYDTMRCDLHWLERHVACEYDSKEHHQGRLSEDAKRLNVLNSEGERVFVVSPEIVADPAALQNLAIQVAHAVGKRLRPTALEETAARRLLRAQLFPWAYHEDGRPRQQWLDDWNGQAEPAWSEGFLEE